MQRHAGRSPVLAAASVLLVASALTLGSTRAQALDSTGTRAVPTYESVGLYWSSPGATAATGCEVSYRAAGTADWKPGLAMWFDARNSECRGSLVSLTPGTGYEVQLNLPGQAATKEIGRASCRERV